MRATSEEVTSARHSSRSPRISLNSSCPCGRTAPRVTERAEMLPSSGAWTVVCLRRSSCAVTCARIESSLASAVLAAVRSCATCCWLSAPLASTSFARAALARASASVASASASPARACARSASTVSGANTASTCPRITVSPTLARTSATRSPPDSAPMIASCQAARLPVACTLRAMSMRCGVMVVTVSAGLPAGLAPPLSCALPAPASPSRPQAAATAAMVRSLMANSGWKVRVPSHRRPRGRARSMQRRVPGPATPAWHRRQ